MKTTIIHLVTLQGYDSRIRQLQDRITAGPARIAELQRQLETERSGLQAELERLEEIKKQRRTLEREIEDVAGKVQRSHIKLSSVKSNKEYQAALKEIEDLKRQQTGVEDQVLELMEETEGGEENSRAAKTRVNGQEAEVERERAAIEHEMETLARELQSLEGDRSALIGLLDQQLLKRYDFIRAHKEGQAVSPVIKGVCRTCHVEIPPQQFRELIRGEELMSCPNCRRIIYWGEDACFQTNNV